MHQVVFLLRELSHRFSVRFRSAGDALVCKLVLERCPALLELRGKPREDGLLRRCTRRNRHGRHITQIKTLLELLGRDKPLGIAVLAFSRPIRHATDPADISARYLARGCWAASCEAVHSCAKAARCATKSHQIWSDGQPFWGEPHLIVSAKGRCCTDLAVPAKPLRHLWQIRPEWGFKLRGNRRERFFAQASVLLLDALLRFDRCFSFWIEILLNERSIQIRHRRELFLGRCDRLWPRHSADHDIPAAIQISHIAGVILFLTALGFFPLLQLVLIVGHCLVIGGLVERRTAIGDSLTA